MEQMNAKVLARIGAGLYLFVGIVYMLMRLIKVWGLKFLVGTLLNWDVSGLHGFIKIFIYLAAAIYLVIALLGFLANGKDKKSLAPVILMIGVIFGLIALVSFLKVKGLLNLIKLIASVCYILAGIRLRA